MDALYLRRWCPLNKFDELSKKILKSKQQETKSYDADATVVRVEEPTVYVKIDGGAIETPCKVTVSCKVGDRVRVRVSGGRCWIIGNVSAPSTDDTKAKEVEGKFDGIFTNDIIGKNGWINLLKGTFNYGDGALVWDGKTLRMKGAVEADELYAKKNTDTESTFIELSDEHGRVNIEKIYKYNNSRASFSIGTGVIDFTSARYLYDFEYDPEGKPYNDNVLDSVAAIRVSSDGNGYIQIHTGKDPFYSELLYSNGVLSNVDLMHESAYRAKSLAGYIQMISKNDYNGVVGLYGTMNSGSEGFMVYKDQTGAVVHPTTSDKRLKNHISELDENEARVLLENLKPQTFTYKDDKDCKCVLNGFYAQDVRDILLDSKIGHRGYLIAMEDNKPNYNLKADENGVVYAIDYAKMLPLVWKGWQMHEERIKELERENSKLESRIERLERMILNEKDDLQG